MMVIEAAAKIRMDERFSCQLRNGIVGAGYFKVAMTRDGTVAEYVVMLRIFSLSELENRRRNCLGSLMFSYCWRAGLKGSDPRTCVMGSALCLPTSILQGCNTLSARTLEKGVSLKRMDMCNINPFVITHLRD
jgi:hypothetical protein